MTKDFEWHFGDELPEDEGERTEARPPGWRRWLVGLVAILLVAGGVYAWWRGRQRNLAQAEAEVQQVARLELRALEENDQELYLSLQDPSDRSWKEAQAAYLATAGLPPPLQERATPVSTSVEGARVVGDRARVQVIHSATLPSGEEARFLAARFYRYTNDGRWLHTAAPSGEGGHSVTFVVGEIEIETRAEDAAWLEPMTSDLAGVAYRFCRLASCPEGVSLELDLAAGLEEGAAPDDGVLPAPFLVGAPQDEAAQDAWEASLGQFVVDRLIARQIGPRPEDEQEGALVEERLRAWLKAKLGVREPMPPDPELLRDALEGEEWVAMWQLWRGDLEGRERAIAADRVDLMLRMIEEEHGAAAVAGLIHRLREADYLTELLGETVQEPWPDFEAELLAHVRKETAGASDDLGAFPAYDLLVRCSETVQTTGLTAIWGWRFDRVAPVLLSVRPGSNGLSPISWSPDGTRLLVEDMRAEGSSLALLQAGRGELEREIPPVAEPIGQYRLAGSGWSPDGSLLAYHVYSQDRGPSFLSPSSSSSLETRVLDVRTGAETSIDGAFVAWSPGGSQVLYATSTTAEASPTPYLEEGDDALLSFRVTDRRGNTSTPIGEGYAAAWSPDGQQVAIVGPEIGVTVHNLASSSTTTLLDRDALQETLGFTMQPFPTFARLVNLIDLSWAPDGEAIALIVSQPGDMEPKAGTLLLIDDQEARVLRRVDGGIYALAWSPDGDWLRTLVSGERISTIIVGRDGSLLLTEDEAIATWSPDGRYLAVSHFSDQGTDLRVLEMATGRWQEVETEGTCWLPVWNPRGPR